MTPQALQRFVVGMLYDSALVGRVYGGEAVEGLSPEGRAALVRVDRLAWSTDPYRRSRTLHALLEEFPVSAAIIGLDKLDAFFSSETFHTAIRNRGSLAAAFARWLPPRARPISDLEAALARARRPRVGGLSGWVRAPGVESIVVPMTTLESYQRARAQLGPDPVSRLVAGPICIDLGHPDSTSVHLLIEPDGAGGFQISTCASALHSLLEFADVPRSRDALSDQARTHGADAGEEAEIIAALIEQGLLVQRP